MTELLIKNINKTPFIESYLSEFDEVSEIKTILDNYSYKKIFSNDILGDIKSNKYKKYDSIIYDNYSDFNDDFTENEILGNVMLIFKLYENVDYNKHDNYSKIKILKQILVNIKNYYEKGILNKIKFGIILNINYSNKFIRNLLKMNRLETLTLSYFYSAYLREKNIYSEVNIKKENIKIFNYLPSSLRLLDVNFGYAKYENTRKLTRIPNFLNNPVLPNKISIFKSVLNISQTTKKIKIKFPFNTINIIVTHINNKKIKFELGLELESEYDLDKSESCLLGNCHFIEEEIINSLNNKLFNNTNKFMIIQNSYGKSIENQKNSLANNDIIGFNKMYNPDEIKVKDIIKTSINFIKIISDLHVSYSQSNYVKGKIKENILQYETKYDKFYWDLISDILLNLDVEVTRCLLYVHVNSCMTFKNYPFYKNLIKSYENFTDKYYEYDKNFCYLVLKQVIKQLCSDEN